MWTDTGSIFYRAPESFEGIYDSKIDIWSTGIVAYELFTGSVPFKARQQQSIIDKITNEEIDFEALKVSKEVKNTIKKMLEKNPEARATSVQT